MKRRELGGAFNIPCIDHYEVVPLTIGGAADKDVLEDPATGARFIAKLGRRNNDVEVATEYAIYLIGRSLPVQVAEGSIAMFRGSLRFLSRYFLDASQAEELVHGMQLFTALYDEGTVHQVLHDAGKEQALFTVQSIKQAFGAHYFHYGVETEEVLFKGLVQMITHDAIIGVMDRHHENWGLIVRRGVHDRPPRFAPLYDSARGLFCDHVDDALPKYRVGRGDRLNTYIGKARPLTGFSGLQPRPPRGHATHSELLAAVFHAYPQHRATIVEVLDAYDWRRVRSDLAALPATLCSPGRRDLILTTLRRRIRAIWREIHGRA